MIAPQTAHANTLTCFVMEFVSNPQFASWYETYNERLEGFVGVATYLTEASETFERSVHTFIKDCSEDEANNFDWMLALEHFVEQLIVLAPQPAGVIEDVADNDLAHHFC